MDANDVTKQEQAAESYVREIEDLDLYYLTDPTTGQHPEVTLYVGGKTFCGKPCSATEWIEAQDVILKKVTGRDRSVFTERVKILKKYDDIQAQASEKMEKGEALTDEELKVMWTPSLAIYLKDAFEFIATPGAASIKVPTDGHYLKIRRAAVDGWSLGTFGGPRS